MNILGLDLGSKTGFAYNSGETFFAGTWQLANSKELKNDKVSRMDRRGDRRVLELHRILTQEMAVWPDPKIVVFEDVQFSTYTMQTQLWSSLRAAVWLAFPPLSGVVVECVPVGTLKRFATGHGGATKESMANYLRARHPKFFSDKLDDNGVDAAWLWLWAQTHLTRMKKPVELSPA